MTDQVLTILKFVLLGLLYLFFARVLWAVWSEVRTPSRRPMVGAPASPRHRPPRPDHADGSSGGSHRSSNSAAAAATSKAGAAAQAVERRGKQQRDVPPDLVMLEPRSRRGITVALGGDVVLGRDPACTIVIDDDAYISQRHVRFFDYEGQPMVEDLGSTNGTFHNGSKLTGSKLLHPGDRVQAGTTVIEAQ